MKKLLTVSIIAIIALIGLSVSVNAAEITATDFVATAVDKTITLTEDTIITTNLVVPAEIEVIDLNNFTLTAKGVFDYNRSNPIVINSKLEIKNGTVERHTSLIRGSIIIVDGSNAELTLNNVVIDGKNVDVNGQR